ncbi:MAG: 3-hydroxyacyl-CoA dehydrogenase [Betaproteobacteria bacterium]|nr:3-hydroxyacyl-CoA dehydrogenase [Betaproteobacteria bacterium]
MFYQLIDTGNSRSFSARHALLESAQTDGDVVIIIGEKVGHALQTLDGSERKTAVLIELGAESLGMHTGESRGAEGSNLLGFSRFRLGTDEPTRLVEVVRQPGSPATALAAAKEIFEGAGLEMAVCGDFDGRIVDRLVRPYYNAALKRLDEGLATADDLDMTLKLGLGYPEGPIALLERTGLEHHYDMTHALFEATGDPAYAPARRARVAKLRAETKA